MHTHYWVSQNKPDYLLLLPMYNKNLKYNNVRVKNTSQSCAQCVLHRLQMQATIVCETIA